MGKYMISSATAVLLNRLQGRRIYLNNGTRYIGDLVEFDGESVLLKDAVKVLCTELKMEQAARNGRGFHAARIPGETVTVGVGKVKICYEWTYPMPWERPGVNLRIR